MSWIIRNAATGRQVAQHKTKKKAEAQAADMTKAHRAINALEDGRPVAFVVEKVSGA